MQDDAIVFSFSGGIADSHELNFYEAARFQYAAAKLIYKIEHFRQKGIVLDRISKKIEADIRVSAAKEGSWELSVILEKIPNIAQCTLKVPLTSLFSYIMNKLKPPSKGKELAMELAQIELSRERERTLQSSEETKRLQIMADILGAKEATAQQALEVIAGYSLPQVNHLKPNAIETEFEKDYIQQELLAEIEFEKTSEPIKSVLSSISDEQLVQLSDLFRKHSQELALPLRGSANSLSISLGQSDQKVCVFDRQSLENLGEVNIDKTPTYIEGIVRAYDKDTGWGKFRNEVQFIKPIAFQVPMSIKKKKLAIISEALRSERIGASFYFVRDASNQPIRLILEDIVSVDLPK
ncbi:MAG: hypothetical protein IPN28_02145 [Alphaproteobacteria bacterium]|nr:MAG: hypothetical protein IPN28_02145 [Alphaproteobacteria bacterium]